MKNSNYSSLILKVLIFLVIVSLLFLEYKKHYLRQNVIYPYVFNEGIIYGGEEDCPYINPCSFIRGVIVVDFKDDITKEEAMMLIKKFGYEVKMRRAILSDCQIEEGRSETSQYFCGDPNDKYWEGGVVVAVPNGKEKEAINNFRNSGLVFTASNKFHNRGTINGGYLE